MGHDDDRKLTYSERDRLRREGGGGGGQPRREGGGLHGKHSTEQYLKKLDRLFSGTKSELEKLIDTVRDAHGTPQLADACRQYVEEAGVPTDPALVSMFLDSRDSELMVCSLEALLGQVGSEGFELSRGLQSQLRTLVDGADDAVASLAEELLEGV